MKIQKKYIGAQVATIIFALYAYSQLGWGNIIPSIIWQVVLIFGIVLIFLNNHKNYRRMHMDAFLLLSIFMLGVSLVWNNHEIARYGFFIETYIILIFAFFWFSYYSDRWHETLIKMMMFCGVFYTFFTYVCVLVPSIYANMIYPIFSFLNYDFDNKAGFTSNYGTNGLYMCTGICAYLAVLLFNPEHGVRKKDIIFLFILLIGMLFSGKRGQTIAIVFATLVCYFCYNTNKKRGRVLKLVGIAIVTIVILYFLSFYFPQILTIVERFIIQSDKGDISTGRFTMWESAFQLFKRKPLFGYGWRFFRFTEFSIDGYDVHNVFLQFLVEVGIIGAIPFYLFIFGNIIGAISLMIKIRKEYQGAYYTKYISAALIFEVFFIVMCATGTAYYSIEYLFTYLLSCSMVMYYSRKIKMEGVKLLYD